MTSISALYPSYVGFDQLFTELEKLVGKGQPIQSSFPPHNIIKVEDNKYVVEMAVAGFSKDEIDIQLDEGNLVIRGDKNTKDEANYVYRGIAARSFTKSIRLTDTMEVRGAEFKDGILRIGLENIIPDHKKPRKVEIGGSLEAFKPQLLQEQKAA